MSDGIFLSQPAFILSPSTEFRPASSSGGLDFADTEPQSSNPMLAGNRCMNIHEISLNHLLDPCLSLLEPPQCPMTRGHRHVHIRLGAEACLLH
ncbi:hypothetical protein AB1N83_011238 [Pleurotus pulmonarius]